MEEGTSLPMQDKEFIFVNPTVILNPKNYNHLESTLSSQVFNELRFGYYVGESCAYPRFDRSNYFYRLTTNPLLHQFPDLSPTYVSFDMVTDQRACDVEKRAEAYQEVYLFWSGGIDSSAVLCAMLKNWSVSSLDKVTIVLNNNSINEYPAMYQSLINGRFKECSTDEFFAGTKRFSNDAMFITGDCGDPILGFSEIYKFDKMFPGIYHKPWANHKDQLLKFFSCAAGEAAGKFVMGYIENSLTCFQIESVYDFLWWIDFNWGYDLNFFNSVWSFQMLSVPDVRKYLEENLVIFFNTKEYQNWAVSTIGTNQKIGDTVATHKISIKKYIYSYNNDIDYYLNKRKIDSTPLNPQIKKSNRLFGIESDYSLIYTCPNIWQ